MQQLKDGVEEGPEEAAAQKQKEEAANNYDTFEMCVDRHWSEKKVNLLSVDNLTSFFSGFYAPEKGMIRSTWVSVLL
jgi:ATP-dependent RNA helicase DDX23/PRP28